MNPHIWILARGMIDAPAVVASALLQQPPTEAQQHARLAVCRGCERLDTTHAAQGEIGHCGACGCGHHRMARLERKAAIVRSTCPLKLWDVTINLPDSRSDP